MESNDWVRPLSPAEPAGAAWAAKTPAQFQLRPLSLGEVLDRTFALYRSRFWLFAGIAMVLAAVHVAALGISLTTAQTVIRRSVIAPAANPTAALANFQTIMTAQAGSYLMSFVYFLVSAITGAATALAVTRVYLGEAVTAKGALAEVLPRWYRWIGIQLWKVGSLIWIPCAVAVPGLILVGLGARGNVVLAVVGAVLLFLAVFAGFPVGVVLYLRNALSIPAAVTEGLTIRPAMRRSKLLAEGTKGRIFVVMLIALVLLEVVAVLQAPLGILMVFAPNQQHYLARGIGMLVAFVGHSLVAPVGEIGLTLLYFDQRVRREALDLQLLLRREAGSAGLGSTHIAAGQPEGYAPLA